MVVAADDCIKKKKITTNCKNIFARASDNKRIFRNGNKAEEYA